MRKNPQDLIPEKYEFTLSVEVSIAFNNMQA